MVLIAAAAIHQVSAALSPWATPLKIWAERDGGGLDGLRVHMCVLDWASYRSDPTAAPMFKDLSLVSPDCARPAEVPYSVLEDEYVSRGCHDASWSGDWERAASLGCIPSGLVFHQSRCGSTLVANMLAVAPGAVSYSEANPVMEAVYTLQRAKLSHVQMVRLMRVVIAAMGRPIAAQRAGAPRPSSGVPADWQPSALYLKLQSTMSLHVGLLREAFPSVPWAFVHRQPLEVLASLLRAARVPSSAAQAKKAQVLAARRKRAQRATADASGSVSMGAEDEENAEEDEGITADAASPAILIAPCMRRYRAPVSSQSHFLRQVLGLNDVSSAVEAASNAKGGSSGGGGGLLASVMNALNPARQVSTLGISPERYCAATVAELTSHALAQAVTARREALTALSAPADEGGWELIDRDAAEAVDAVDGASLATLLASQGHEVKAELMVKTADVSSGMLLNVSTGRGTVAGIGQAVLLDYSATSADDVNINEGASLAQQVVAMLQWHMRPPSSSGESSSSPALSQPAVAAMMSVARKYSKARGQTSASDVSGSASGWTGTGGLSAFFGSWNGAPGGGGGGGVAGRGGGRGGWRAGPRAALAGGTGFQQRAMDEQGNFVGDASAKQARSWPALRKAADKYLTSLRDIAVGFNPRNDGPASKRSSTTAAQAPPPLSTVHEHVTASSAGYDVRLLPLGAGYPAQYPLSDILTDWNPDVTSVPAHYGRYSSLRVFDYSNPTELAEAEVYRRAEVPFIIRNVPSLTQTVAKWRDDDYLLSRPGVAGAAFSVEINEDNTHFMYYRRPPGGGGGGGRRGRKLLEQAPSSSSSSSPAAPKPPAASSADSADGNSGVSNRRLHEPDSAASPIPIGAPGWKPPLKEGHMPLGEWFAKAAAVRTQVAAEEAATGALPPGWTAPEWLQAWGTGINALDRNASLQRLACNAAWLASNGGPVTSDRPLPEPRMPRQQAVSYDKERAEVRWPHGRTISEYLGLSGANNNNNSAVLAASEPLRRAKKTLYYLRASTGARGMADFPFIAEDMPLFDGSKGPSFFVVVPSEQRGIHCRMGQPGIIAESHFDSGRNFIAMVRGRKRYIMSSPQQCPHLEVMTGGPSARHSKADWTSREGIASIAGARALEVILEAGDVLYVPAFWFHFIVSLEVNIQCNTRSGTPPHGLTAIEDCGLTPKPSEAMGEHTDTVPPPHHVLAMATSGLDPAAPVIAGRRMLALAQAAQLVGQIGGGSDGAAATSSNDDKTASVAASGHGRLYGQSPLHGPSVDFTLYATAGGLCVIVGLWRLVLWKGRQSRPNGAAIAAGMMRK